MIHKDIPRALSRQGTPSHPPRLRVIKTCAYRPNPSSKNDGHLVGTIAEGMQKSIGWTDYLASSQAFATQLLSHFSRLTGTQALAESVLQEASRKEKEKRERKPLSDISNYLQRVPTWELKLIRKLSHLSSLTYKPHKVTEKYLRQCHNLSLVTSSWSHGALPAETTRTAMDVSTEGDGMSVSYSDARTIYSPSYKASEDLADKITDAKLPTQPSLPLLSKKLIVAEKLAEAALAASAAARPLMESAAGSIAAGFASLPLRNPMSGGSSGNSEDSKALMTISTETLPLQHFDPSSVKIASSTGSLSSSTPACPSEWFICDDKSQQLRVFVIQGSDTIDHWKLNLTFDPVTFEDSSLGVTVHRGVYEAALILYDRFLPFICEHLDSSPFARVTFTGHSIGGSLATLLMLMYRRRGVLTNQCIAPVYTFGAPSVFCEGPLQNWSVSSVGSGDSIDLQDQAVLSSGCNCTKGGPSSLLAALDLEDQVVRNVIMHRDIVPRAFACDYSLIADILKGWGNGFRGHCCLHGAGRKHLYYFVGRMIVLQPDRVNTFVGNDLDHPLLPPGPGLHYLAEPNDMLMPGLVTTAPTLEPTYIDLQQHSVNTPGILVSHRVPKTARAAVMELMDNPHPLETLADPAAYLTTGSISRFHNPDHYTLAFGRIIYLRRQLESQPNTGFSLRSKQVAKIEENSESLSIWEDGEEFPVGALMAQVSDS